MTEGLVGRGKTRLRKRKVMSYLTGHKGQGGQKGGFDARANDLGVELLHSWRSELKSKFRIRVGRKLCGELLKRD